MILRMTLELRQSLGGLLLAVLLAPSMALVWLLAASAHAASPHTHSISSIEAATKASGDQAGSIDRAYRFLYAQMDRLMDVVTVLGRPGESEYYPALTGDVKAVTIVAPDPENARSDRSNLRLRFDPKVSSGDGWAGVYFLYPTDNWGRSPGRNLKGATKLIFWARADEPADIEFLAGGINRPQGADPSRPHADSFGPVKTGPITVGPSWTEYTIALARQDLSSVICAFGVIARWTRDATPFAIELKDVRINQARREMPHFAVSYGASECDTRNPPNIANVYDQALVLLAFLARGHPEDLQRAEVLANTLIEAQRHDRTFRDGRLRNAYAGGELIDPNLGAARLPGRWDERRGRFLEDAYAVGSDTGNMAWAAIALVQAHALLPRRDGDPYLTAAVNLADWIVQKTRLNDALGGFSAGYEGFETAAGKPEGQDKLTYRSTEHNIDLVALFDLLADHFGRDSEHGRAWAVQGAHARTFVEAMWQRSANGAYLATGTSTEAGKIITSPVPLDAQTWSVLGMGEPRTYEKALNWALQNCTAGKVTNAFDFDCGDGDGAWWEGTAQVVTALNWLGQTSEAEPILARLREAQVQISGPAEGAIPAASVCGLTTGFYRDWGPKGEKEVLPWTFTNAPHVAATAWYALAELAKNPFRLSAER